MNRPQLIFFDAVGTLFGVRGSVGDVYGEIARQHGVYVSIEQLNKAFYQSFKVAGSPAFPGRSLSEIPDLEFEWWNAIVKQTFAQLGVLKDFSNFSTFFAELYDHFATADPWILYPDVEPTLEELRARQITLGILSNFDSRLYSVLKALNLKDFFSSVTISTEAGAAKPSPQIFKIAIAKHDYPVEQIWHVGNSLEEDFKAANAAGLRGIWLDRSSKSR